MFWRKNKTKRSSRARALDMGFRALFTGGCFAAFAIFAWDVDIATVLELVLFLILVMVAMVVPAAIFVALLKLISNGLKRVRGEDD